jgi:hypothetical protein
MRITIFVSVALNLLLLTTLVLARVDSSRFTVLHEEASGLAELAESELIGSARDITSAAQLVETLKSTPLSSRAIRILTLGWLEASVAGSYVADAVPYWQQGFAPALDELVRQATVSELLRLELMNLFGPDAASDPAFDGPFRPMGSGYAFLGSEAQVAIQQHQIETLKQSAVVPQAPSFRSACIGHAAFGRGERPSVTALPESFSGADQHEYSLRYSPLAEQLRQSGAAQTEAEFRALFDLAQGLDRESSPSDRAQIREELRTRMGQQAFDRLVSLRDPLYSELSSFLAEQGFGASIVAAAYSVMNRAQDELLGIMARGGDYEGLIPALGSARQSELARLGELLGEGVAKALVMTRDQAVSRYPAGVGTRC